MIVFDADQVRAIEGIRAFIKDTDRRFLLLTGFAGTGKTTTLAQGLAPRSPEIKLAYVAPTHQAVDVMREAADDPFAVFATLHSILELKERRNFDTGAVTYERDTFNTERKPRWNEFTLFIIDEASMVNSELFSHIIDNISSKQKVIFVGDKAQLPPIGERISKVFLPDVQQDLGMLVFTLTEIHRQTGDSAILPYATDIRNGLNPAKPLVALPGLIPIVGQDMMKQTLDTLFLSPEFKLNPRYAKVLTYHRNVAQNVNNYIRKQQHAHRNVEELDELYPGEFLLADCQYTTSLGPKIRNNQSFSIIDLTEDTLTIDEIVYPVYKAVIDVGRNGKVNQMLVTMPRNLKYWNQQLAAVDARIKKTRDSAVRRDLWRQWYAIKDSVLWYVYNYAITTHKAQGSTFVNTIMLLWDLKQNYTPGEFVKLWYTATTRASKNLYIE